MAEHVVVACLERTGKLLIWEGMFLSAVINQVHDVQLQLKKLQSFLKDADKKRDREDVFRWVREVREVALRMEDVLEIYAVDIESKREYGQLKLMITRCLDMLCECITLHKLDPEMKSIQKKLIRLVERKESLKLEESGESSNVEQDRQELSEAEFSGLIEPYFVGRVKEIGEVVSHLKNEKRVRQVVSVWGMGGLGKTTFARRVYKEVRHHFEASAWVCLSQKFVLLEVLQNILKDLVKNLQPEAMDIEQLRQKLHEVLTEKKCLVVLDDMWSVDDWRKLEGALPYEAEVTGTKLLLTTRIQKVAELGFVYKLEGLTIHEGWKLLSEKAFPTRDNHIIDPYAEDRVDPQKEKIGRQIVEKCQGLPLAISALGGILKGKKALNDWRSVELDTSSGMISAGDSDDEYGSVRRILARSYDDLTSRHKQLFLYLGNYGEDKEIDTLKLYQLWIAEGMVSSGVKQAKGKMLMDVAESYLSELAERSLVQVTPAPHGYPFKFSTCRLHDLIRDLCVIKRKEEDVFNLTDIRDAHSESYDFQAVLSDQLIALANYVCGGSDIRVPLNKNEYGRLRSLAFAGDLGLPEIVQSLQQFKLVRVLSLESFEFELGKLPQELCYLIHLRYLSLFGCKLNELAPFIGEFRYLETLDLRVESESVIMIANVLWKLTRLKHLSLPHGDYSSTSGKLNFNGLDELEMLWNFNVSKCEIDDIVKLGRLQVIVGVEVESPQELEVALKVFASKRFTKLYVQSTDLLSSSESPGSVVSSSNYLTQLFECPSLTFLLIGPDVGGSFPKEINTRNFSPSLIEIALWDCEYEDDPMPLLERLPNLRRLRLYRNSYLGTEIVCSATGFGCLTSLFLNELPNLERWSLEKGAMPNLFELEISECEELEMLPDELVSLKLLTEMNVSDMSEAFNERIKGEDFHKVNHVPSVTVDHKKIDTHGLWQTSVF